MSDYNNRYVSRGRRPRNRGRYHNGGRARQPDGGNGRFQNPNPWTFNHSSNYSGAHVWKPLRRDNDSVRTSLFELGLSAEQVDAILNLRPRTATSTDKGLSANLVRNVLQYAKLYNHKQNWRTLPKTLHRGLDNFISNIHLPMSNDVVVAEMFELAEDFGRKLCDTVQFHLLCSVEALISDLRLCSADALKNAQYEAEPQLQMNTFRIREAWASLHSDMALYRPKPNTISDTTRTTTATTTVTSIINNTVPKTVMITADVHAPMDGFVENLPNSKAKRKNESPINIENNKKQHTGQSDNDVSDDMEDESDTLSDDEKSPGKFKDNVVVHRGRDNIRNWKIAKIPLTCKSLVVGDSTLRHWPADERVSVQAFPGAHLIDIANVLAKWEPPTHVSTVIVAAGVNNYEKSIEQNRKEINQLRDAMNTNACNQAIVSIAVSNNHSEESRISLELINVALRDTFQKNFIDIGDVEKFFFDKQHYTVRSAAAISKVVYDFLQ